MMKSVVMHAELLLSDPLLFRHVEEECATLYLPPCLIFMPPPHPTSPLHHYELIPSSSPIPCLLLQTDALRQQCSADDNVLNFAEMRPIPVCCGCLPTDSLLLVNTSVNVSG